MKIKEGYPGWLKEPDKIKNIPWPKPWIHQHHRICSCCGRCHECMPYQPRPWRWHPYIEWTYSCN